ncbi:hypothetical protein TorRG33x02_070270, partial [Trema orientale]
MDVEYFSGEDYYFEYYFSDEDENYSGYEYYFDEYYYHSLEDNEDENCSADDSRASDDESAHAHKN